MVPYIAILAFVVATTMEGFIVDEALVDDFDEVVEDLVVLVDEVAEADELGINTL